MKRLALFFAMVLILGVMYSQERNYTLTHPVSYYALPYRATDSVSSNSNDSTWYFQFLLVNFDYPAKVNMKVTLDEISGTGNCAFSLQGKQFYTDSWTNITTVNYSGAGSDTTFVITDGTARQFRYYRGFLDKVYGTAGRVEVDALEVKVWQTQ